MITNEEVVTTTGTLPSLDPCPNAVNIHALRIHIKCILQLLPCPQIIQHGWKSSAMLPPMYAMLVIGGAAFCKPNDPGPAAIYVHADANNLAPLNHMEQATIDATFAQEKHFFNS